MDRIYRFQRHLYDATRVGFLLGRNALLEGMVIRPGMRVLELGCGTARNLIRLARSHPDGLLFGVDVSGEMLKTASRKIRAAGLEERIVVRRSAAESTHYRRTFELAEPFDLVFFSYSLTMMPAHAEALDAARESLAAEGRFHAVDFWDNGGWPTPLRSVMARWLSLFHVHFEPAILDEIEQRFAGTTVRPILGRYAFLASTAAYPGSVLLNASVSCAPISG